MSDRARRIGLNEAVFRAVNEEIEGLAERFSLTGEKLDLICECGDGSCATRIRLGHGEYVALRASPTLFAIVPGHEVSGVEVVVERHDGYAIVRKTDDELVGIAEQTAPDR